MRVRSMDVSTADLARAEAWLLRRQRAIDGYPERATWMDRVVASVIGMAEKQVKADPCEGCSYPCASWGCPR